MNYSSYQLIIFDWDGTLMDSINRIVSSMQAAAEYCSITVPTVEEVRDIIGLSLPKALETLFPNITESKTKILIEQYKHQFIKINTTPTHLFADTLTLLNTLLHMVKYLLLQQEKAETDYKEFLNKRKQAVFLKLQGVQMKQILNHLQKCY
jgi:phosphoglycolate phosphatase